MQTIASLEAGLKYKHHEVFMVVNTVEKLQEISLRLDHLESAGEWIARSMVHVDSTASHTGSLVTVLADDIRLRVLELVTELEKIAVVATRNNLQ